jgi:hypothetical protein
MLLGCLSTSSVKVRSSSIKNDGCGLCTNNKSILILACKHRCCVKCYNKIRYCTQCEKDKLKFRCCWCC